MRSTFFVFYYSVYKRKLLNLVVDFFLRWISKVLVKIILNLTASISKGKILIYLVGVYIYLLILNFFFCEILFFIINFFGRVTLIKVCNKHLFIS